MSSSPPSGGPPSAPVPPTAAPAATSAAPSSPPSATSCATSPASSKVTSEEQKALSDLGELKGKPAADIEAELTKDGYSGVNGFGGGKVYTKDLGNGRTMAVRIDPATVRTPPKGFADEVAHAHKESVPTSAITSGNYSPKAPDLLRFDDMGRVSTDPRAVHIPIN